MQTVAQASAVSYSGPLPPASEFERYEAAAPGTGARIIGLAEDSSKRSYEIQMDNNRTSRHVTWSVVAIIAAVAAVVLVVSLALIGAGSVALGSIGSIASAVFIGIGVMQTWISSRKGEREVV